jgi:AcrR family transcriptional regulator
MDRKEVIKITLDLIKEKKLEKTSIGEIVKRLDSSPGNLYYHFKNKNEIYKEVLDYSTEEILKNLDRVKTEKNSRNYLFNLTRVLIKFLEEREEILFFLISMKGTCYLDEEVNLNNFLEKFKNTLLNKKEDIKHVERVNLKLSMFLGSVYEVLYMNKLANKRNLEEEEIEEIYICFFEDNAEKRYRIYKQEELKLDLL